MEKIHFLGICGTFMASLAMLAKERGYEVSGQDQAIYPPMSELLAQSGIQLQMGYRPEDIPMGVNKIIIGNALSRGNPCVEYVLNHSMDYQSGPAFLEREFLLPRHVLVVAGTHGKTTTASMLAWILEDAGLEPGFLIGGVAKNFSVSARLGGSSFFVIEGDEYDTAFFDKQSKFLHYRPHTLIVNNIEFDHADIFPDIEAIKRQFQFLLRCVPSEGTLIYPVDDENINEVVARGCYSQQQTFGVGDGMWQVRVIKEDGSCFEIWRQQQCLGSVDWPLIGLHNVKNALAAAIAAFTVGVDQDSIIKALATFKGVKRRLDVIAKINNITVYDDFAHHPTAIKTTLQGIKQHVGSSRVIAIVHCASNTMSMGVQQADLAAAFSCADQVIFWQDPNIDWDIQSFCARYRLAAKVYPQVDDIVQEWSRLLVPGDHVVLMSNRSFDGLHKKLINQLARMNGVVL